MKRFLVVMGLLAISVGLYACGDTTAEASIPSGFEIITQDSFNNGSERLITVKHIKTKCYYTLTRTIGDGTGGGIAQMFIEKDGVSVPYCEGGR